MTEERKKFIKTFTESKHTEAEHRTFLRSLNNEEYFYALDIEWECYQNCKKRLKEALQAI